MIATSGFRQYYSNGINEITLNVKWHNWQFCNLAGGFFFSNCSADLIVEVVQAAEQKTLTYSPFPKTKKPAQNTKLLSEALF